MFRFIKIVLFFAIIISFQSCSKYQKLVKNGTPDQKFEAAMKYYEKDDFYHSQQLFDELIVLLRGTDRLETAYYHYAQTYYLQNDYMVASYHFKYFAKTFPKSKKAEECLYLSAYCKYLDSPPENLDQSSTKTAISEMQMFINMYPDSEKVDEANNIMDELRKKLVVKDFENAKQYLTTEYYKAAVYAFERHLTNYPASPFREEAMYLTIEADYIYATKSINYRQKERFTKTLADYNNYVAKFPEGQYLNKAEKLRRSAKHSLDKINNKKL
ncbi:MAG: outer membrane protein assembly factor BamD [Bacteroidetes bacterium 4572_112]|nr:MAG: outer membrane protein assembly factor BamD [Bacteroidetes bacterium 4572_112]